MRKKLATILLSMFAIASQAQDTDRENRLANIDWQEDSVEITTIKDIVRTQQMVTNRTAQAGHFAKVWSNHGFFNIAYHTKGTLDPVSTIPLKKDSKTDYIGTGVAYLNGKAPMYTNNWGASIMAGKNIKLHKPIANTLQFNIDFTGIDLSINHYTTEPGEDGDKKNVYDSKAVFDYKDKNGVSQGDRRYSHWNLEKYDISYGMSIGPSLTLAPFTHINGARGLHFLKFNFYYHVGYNATLMLMNSDPESDKQYKQLPDNPTAAEVDAYNLIGEYNENQLLLGHNLYQSIGFNMTWKRIGLGYEHRWGNLKYKNLVLKSEYGDYSYKFNATTNRIYLTYRFGK